MKSLEQFVYSFMEFDFLVEFRAIPFSFHCRQLNFPGLSSNCAVVSKKREDTVHLDHD